MQFLPIDLRSIDRTPPSGWKKMWYGYFQMEKVISQEKKDIDRKSHRVSNSSSLKGEDYIERQFFLNIIRSLKGHVNLFELGAGRGDWCMALAGVIDFNLIDTEVTSYNCLAIEAEPAHFGWTKTHLEGQQIKAIPVYGAISSKTGKCKFYSVVDPASNYGQSVRDDGNLTVPCYTIDYLIDTYKFSKIDIMHVDIQGTEYDALLGATEALKNKTIKYMIIGTHRPELNKQIINFIKPYGYESLFSIECNGGICDTPFGRAVFPVDGLLVLKC